MEFGFVQKHNSPSAEADGLLCLSGKLDTTS
jgi:hypothetical protein